jgi:hypothetical protein
MFAENDFSIQKDTNFLLFVIPGLTKPAAGFLDSRFRGREFFS